MRKNELSDTHKALEAGKTWPGSGTRKAVGAIVNWGGNQVNLRS